MGGADPVDVTEIYLLRTNGIGLPPRGWTSLDGRTVSASCMVADRRSFRGRAADIESINSYREGLSMRSWKWFPLKLPLLRLAQAVLDGSRTTADA